MLLAVVRASCSLEYQYIHLIVVQASCSLEYNNKAQENVI